MQLTKTTKTILGVAAGAAVIVGGIAGFEALKAKTGTVTPPPRGGGTGTGGTPSPAALSVTSVQLGVA